jgi:hypothetical protein
MADPYCSVAEYEARYGAVGDERLLAAVLDDASDVMDAAFEAAGKPASSVSARRLCRVCRQVAYRLMPQDTSMPTGIPAGVASASTTMGPFSQQVTFARPYGTPRLQYEELRALGLGGGATAGTIVVGGA